MPQITLLGYPLSHLILYFCIYSFVGWSLETAYCSVMERRFAIRGFLHGPICPIYGVGALLMVLFFQPFAGNILVFYLISTVTMSAWEYFVGWLLEVTTHMKYWDYSMFRFNLKGRICLWVCLVWGVLSYVCIFWIHPAVSRLVNRLPEMAQVILAAVLALAVLTDAVFTIRELALMTKAMNKLQQLGGEVRLQISLGRMELADKLAGAKGAVGDRLHSAREAMASALPDTVAENSARLRAKHDALIAAAEHRTRRFRRNYVDFSAPRVDIHTRRAIRDRGQQMLAEKKALRAQKKQNKKR